ncbi:MAG TPA: AsmA family protein [Spirochaetes bacterium]|nr:AsmA family protein [Spirochaetota bacterium]
MKPVKIFKISAIVLLIIAVLFGGGAVGIYFFFPKGLVLSAIKTRAEEALKTRVSIEGLDYSLKGIVLNKISIFDSADEKSAKLISADEAVLRFSLLELALKRNFNITYILLNGLKLTISYDSEGNSNIGRLLSSLTKGDGPSPVTASIDTIRLKNAHITLVNPQNKNFIPLKGEYIIDCSVNFKKGNVFSVEDCEILLPEKRGRLRPDITIAVTKNNFEITGDVDLDRCSLGWVYAWGRDLKLPYLDISGEVKNLKITRDRVEGFLKGVSTLANKKPLAVNGFCRVSINAEKVFLSNIAGSIQTTSFLVEEFLFNFDGDILKFRIRNIDAQIGDITPILSFLPAELYGGVKGDLGLDNGRYSGTLNLNVGYGKNGRIVKDLQTTVAIKSNIIGKTPIQLRLFNTPVEASLSSPDGDFKKFRIDLSAAEFGFPNEEKTDSRTPFKPVKLPVEIQGTLAIGSLKIDRFALNAVKLAYRFAGGLLTFDSVTFGLLGGDVNGNGSVDLGTKTPAVRFLMNFNNIRAQNAANMSEKFKNRFFGNAAGKAEIAFTLDGKGDLYNSMEGKIEFNINNGKLVNTGVQNGLGIWLSELRYKLRDLEFSRIYGNITLGGGAYTINSFIFNSQDIRLRMDGSFNRQLAGALNISLEFTGNFIQDLPNPVFLQLGKYKKGRWYIIPFESRGNDITDSKNIKRLD